ncbi:MAG: redoxin domain-containing protein [Deltaproteobacteria bacterium]|nr:redoxin domain-containing protein [Deltaproteobacteria bacterium]
MPKRKTIILMLLTFFLFAGVTPLAAQSVNFKNSIYNPGILKARDSRLKVKVGDLAPQFSLPAVGGKKISLKDFRGEKVVVLSFVPAAWTPVCSDQWPGYNIVEELFKEHDAILLGITVDNIPTLFSWTQQMGDLWFPVLSDFWPHGAAADSFGLLRGDGIAERALVIIDKAGVIRYLGVGDINVRPPLETLIKELQKLDHR